MKLFGLTIHAAIKHPGNRLRNRPQRKRYSKTKPPHLPMGGYRGPGFNTARKLERNADAQVYPLILCKRLNALVYMLLSLLYILPLEGIFKGGIDIGTQIHLY